MPSLRPTWVTQQDTVSNPPNPSSPLPPKKLVAIPNAGEDAEKQDFSSFANGNERWYHILETVQTFL
jgi:hypothetical protein